MFGGCDRWAMQLCSWARIRRTAFGLIIVFNGFVLFVCKCAQCESAQFCTVGLIRGREVGWQNARARAPVPQVETERVMADNVRIEALLSAKILRIFVEVVVGDGVMMCWK